MDDLFDEAWGFDLVRSNVPLESKVVLDDITLELTKPFDFQTDGVSRFYPYLIPDGLPKRFALGVIVGGSGSGKSSLLKHFGQVSEVVWNDGSIVSNFGSPAEASEKLSAAGLMSIPDWVKPFSVLSNGQKFRANLARQLVSNTVIDEFTSVVDRNVAKAASVSLSRYVRSNELENIVLATCHRDILEFLQPDWVIDTDRGQWASGRYLQQPNLVVKVYACSNSIWSTFAEHHYLTEKINKAAHCFAAVWEGQLVGFYAVLAYPSGTVRNAYRGHRLVILPEFQGFGFGHSLAEVVAQHYVDNGKRFFAKTSHPRLGEYRDQSPLWKATSKNHKRRTDVSNKHLTRWKMNPNRWSYSHEYIGGS
ncbi:MAG: GNAT family N-acetyltransferase [Caulobacteraceae bacterium]|nr:GNAT family N-acetyltransferase [Caulobacteraceae bacterium]